MEKKLELVARQQQKEGSATEWTAWAEAVRENIVQSQWSIELQSKRSCQSQVECIMHCAWKETHKQWEGYVTASGTRFISDVGDW